MHRSLASEALLHTLLLALTWSIAGCGSAEVGVKHYAGYGLEFDYPADCTVDAGPERGTDYISVHDENEMAFVIMWFKPKPELTVEEQLDSERTMWAAQVAHAPDRRMSSQDVSNVLLGEVQTGFRTNYEDVSIWEKYFIELSPDLRLHVLVTRREPHGDYSDSADIVLNSLSRI